MQARICACMPPAMHWLAWGAQAFDQAQRPHKPIFVTTSSRKPQRLGEIVARFGSARSTRSERQ